MKKIEDRLQQLEQRCEQLESRVRNLEDRIQTQPAAIEGRLRGIWKQDFQNGQHGFRNEIRTQVDSKVEAAVNQVRSEAMDIRTRLTRQTADIVERLKIRDGNCAERHESLKKYLEAEVQGLVIETFETYGVLGRDGQPIEYGSRV